MKCAGACCLCLCLYVPYVCVCNYLCCVYIVSCLGWTFITMHSRISTKTNNNNIALKYKYLHTNNMLLLLLLFLGFHPFIRVYEINYSQVGVLLMPKLALQLQLCLCVGRCMCVCVKKDTAIFTYT